MGFALICIQGNRLPYVSSLETRQRPKTSPALRKPCPVETPCSVYDAILQDAHFSTGHTICFYFHNIVTYSIIYSA